MFRDAEDGAIQSDAYIDALLTGHAREPIPLRGAATPTAGLRHVIRLLERGLPRYHPSFMFEERLAGQLRALAESGAAPEGPAGAVFPDRRLIVGGALASGVSIGAAAAMWAWRRRPHASPAREA